MTELTVTLMVVVTALMTSNADDVVALTVLLLVANHTMTKQWPS